MSIVPADTPREAAAFLRRIEKTLKPGHPSFCVVVVDDDGRPHVLAAANRTTLVQSAAELMATAVDLGREDRCMCETCDGWTARAKTALAALGITPAPSN